MNIEINNIWLARSLHKLLHILKYQTINEDAFTPHAAELSNTILDQIIKFYIEEANEDEVNLWHEWRKLDKSRLEYNIIVEKLNEEKIFTKNLSYEQKKEIVEIFSSPFEVCSELEQELINIISEV